MALAKKLETINHFNFYSTHLADQPQGVGGYPREYSTLENVLAELVTWKKNVWELPILFPTTMESKRKVFPDAGCQPHMWIPSSYKFHWSLDRLVTITEWYSVDR
jgi:hypothetical protein